MSAHSLPQDPTPADSSPADELATMPVAITALIHTLTQVTYEGRQNYDELNADARRGIRRRAICVWRMGHREAAEAARRAAASKIANLLEGSYEAGVAKEAGTLFANIAIDTFHGYLVADNQPLTREAR